ncbi:hypothetical protein [Variovorax sp.]|uniref:phage tail fiber protein n=1 Tax=Variovorax sp. TaxID=1871043 RepID=UPI0037DA0EA6
MSLHFPAEGRNYLLNVGVHGGAQVTTWYIALFEGDYTPQEDDAAANIGARATEITAYSQTTRPEFVESAAVGGATDNEASVAQFTLTAPKTVRAFGLLSAAGKGAATGTLLAFQRLSSPRSYDVGDVIKVPTSLTLSNPVT